MVYRLWRTVVRLWGSGIGDRGDVGTRRALSDLSAPPDPSAPPDLSDLSTISKNPEKQNLKLP